MGAVAFVTLENTYRLSGRGIFFSGASGRPERRRSTG